MQIFIQPIAFDDQYRARVQQSAMFNLPGGTVTGIPGLATPGFNPLLQQIPGMVGGVQGLIQQTKTISRRAKKENGRART